MLTLNKVTHCIHNAVLYISCFFFTLGTGTERITRSKGAGKGTTTGRAEITGSQSKIG